MWRCLIDFFPCFILHTRGTLGTALNVVFFPLRFFFFTMPFFFFNGRERNHCLRCNNGFMREKNEFNRNS